MGEFLLTEDHVTRARGFAESVHKDQKWGELPYTFHLEAVHLVYTSVEDDLEGRCGCYLHDCVEDSKEPHTTRQEIVHLFGPRVLEIVEFCTQIPGKNRKEKVRLTNARTERSDDFRAMLVKLSDRIANVENSIHSKNSFYDMYRKEQIAFKKAIYRNVYPANYLLQERLDSLF